MDLFCIREQSHGVCAGMMQYRLIGILMRGVDKAFSICPGGFKGNPMEVCPLLWSGCD